MTLLANVIDLLSGAYREFLDTDLQRVLDHLSNEMVRSDELVGPALRGNPRWDRTALLRLSGALRPGLYVSRTARRSFDLPENLLLRWLIADIGHSVRGILRRVGTVGAHPDLQLIQSRLEEAVRHHWFSAIPEPMSPTIGMLVSAERHRRPEYRNAAKLARRRMEFAEPNPLARWYAIVSLLAANWLEPVSDDDLFELYVLVMVLDIIETDLGFGSPVEYGLVVSRRAHVALFESDQGQVKVFFDQSPLVLGVEGRYRQVISRYDTISGSERRPDIIIRYFPRQEGVEPGTAFVEVKRTSDGAYISDSIYKSFAYLHDFAEVWTGPPRRPRLVLALQAAVGRVDRKSYDEVLITCGEDRDELRDALASALGVTVV